MRITEEVLAWIGLNAVQGIRTKSGLSWSRSRDYDAVTPIIYVDGTGDVECVGLKLEVRRKIGPFGDGVVTMTYIGAEDIEVLIFAPTGDSDVIRERATKG